MQPLKTESPRADGSALANVDGSDDPAARVKYLDDVQELEEVGAYKQETFRRIGLKPGSRVLDIGCGTGDDVRAMTEIVGPGGRAVGVDSSATMIEEARHRSEGSELPVEFVQASAYELPFADDSFDAARLDRVLQHLNEPVAALREAARVVRSGGRINAVDPDFGTLTVATSYPALERRIDAWWTGWREEEPGSYHRGRYLYEHFLDAGLVDLHVEAGSPAIFDLSVAEGMMSVISIAHRAAEAGAITRDEAELWERDLRERAARGRFLLSFIAFAVTGEVPDPVEAN